VKNTLAYCSKKKKFCIVGPQVAEESICYDEIADVSHKQQQKKNLFSFFAGKKTFF
jgi:hypothetical protein